MSWPCRCIPNFRKSSSVALSRPAPLSFASGPARRPERAAGESVMPLRPPESFDKQAFPNLSRQSLRFWIDWLQWAPAGLGCALYLQGKGSAAALVLLSYFIPAFRFLVAPTFRRRVLD